MVVVCVCGGRIGGGGGKGTWGKPGSEHNMVSVLDRRDPNYPEEDDGVVFDSFEPELSLEELKTQVGEIVREFFSNGDTEEVWDALSFGFLVFWFFG